ncbi:mitochondrial small ribosomal subunit Rsm22-domain-containing protein [Schizothecium vesticola]|uniref:Mitochondrial small ribosomal subunit Rsm22-domain-containing protein n=1 Tax=Schizothecium vesticola TaxID=314040 RepID=A0AA40K7W8_9PEZI|nr:mitochondrial small ribosomal subunit Rsm22-domain-containing protein [Schizothecium vesticola]
MISASKIQNRCPSCKVQLLGFYDALLVSRSRAGSRPFHTPQSFAAAHRRQPLNPVRRFSTTRLLLQEPPAATSASQERDRRTELKAEDTETIVRQARQTFGQTLPAGYLTDAEYQLYERLFGPPTRETRPEDVGIPFPGEGGDIIENQSGNALLRETEDGGYEEVDYVIENPTVVDESPEAGDEATYAVDENPMTEDEIDADADAEATALLRAVLEPEKEVTIAEAPIDYLSAAANNQREYDALWKLQQDFERATLRDAEEAAARDAEEAAEAASQETAPTPEAEELNLEVQKYEEEIDEYEARFDEPPTERTHPNTALGLFGTHPSTVFLPATTFVEPIAELLKRTSMTHVKATAEKAFGGPGLPFSPATPSIKGKLPQKGVQLEAGHHQMTDIEADAYIATVLPGMYATVMSTLVETRKRLGASWLHDLLARDGGKGPRVLDVGGGGAGLAAWEEVLRAEWEVLLEKKLVKGRDPPGKKTVVVGSDALRHRISRFLHNTSFIPRLPDYMHSVEGSERMLESDGTPAPRKTFDVIICSHVLMPMESAHRRKAIIDNLWAMLDPNGGVLIVLEKGHPRGFEAVADVRMRLLDEFIIPPHPEPVPEELVATTEQAEAKRQREPGMIVAPCTNHRKCPMYLTPGLSPGRKDACHFEQRFIRPPFLQRVVGGSARNHEDIKFSYVVVRRGMTPSDLPPPGVSRYLQGKEAADRSFAGYDDKDHAPNPLSLPRSVLPPLKRHGHVTFQLCTPDAAIERWVVPKSFSRQAYRDARKSQWGDLWALGAKTRARANVRLGKDGADSVLTDGGVRSRRAAEAARGGRLKVVEILADPHRGMVGAREKYPKNRTPVERRTKGGRIVKIHDLLKEAGIDDMEDADDIEDREFLKGP